MQFTQITDLTIDHIYSTLSTYDSVESYVLFWFMKHYKPAIANISSMSSSLSGLLICNALLVEVLLFSTSSKYTTGPESFCCPSSPVLLKLVLVLDNINLFQSDLEWLLRPMILFVTAGKRKVLTADPWGDKTWHTSCLKTRSFLWTLSKRADNESS